MKSSLLSRSISIYLNPYFKYLADILMRREGYESRSDFISDMLEHLFVKAGLWDKGNQRPTQEALKRSHSVRRLGSLLDVLEKEEQKSSIFDGIEGNLPSKKTQQRTQRKRKRPR